MRRWRASLLAPAIGAVILAVPAAPAWAQTAAPDPALAPTPPALLGPAPVASVLPDAAAVAAFIAALWPDAERKGVSRAAFEAATAGLTPDADVLALAANQPELQKTTGAYLALLVSDTRIANGRAKLAELDAVLAAVEALHGVDRHVLVAIWGIETAYGTLPGTRDVRRSLLTLALTDARRGAFWRGELVATLAILARGDTTADKLVGSWAGAMGHTQFMPTTFERHAVDFDRDGRRDIWGTPVDALASAANYLRASGWTTGHGWGAEVALPAGFDVALAAPGERRAWPLWRALGVEARASVREPLPEAEPLELILPAGASGPAFLVSPNFRALLRYNASVAYALAVGHLADRLAGGAPLATGWPPEDRALSRGEREALQSRLQARGFDPGGIDGIVGAQTRTAIRAFQKTRGLPADGYPSAALLDILARE
jgi:membrane-bound lytic murein transglycosylase B